MRLLLLLLIFLTQFSFAQSGLQAYHNAVDSYLTIQKEGSRSLLDGLFVTFETISKAHEINPETYLGTLVYKARIRSSQNKFNEASSLLDSATVFQNSNALINGKLNHAIAYYTIFVKQMISKKKDSLAAETFFVKYKDQPDNDPYVAALSYEYMGRFYQDYGAYDTSVIMLKEAIKRFDSVKSNAALSVAYTVLGATYAYQENFEMEARYYDAALRTGAMLKEPNYDVLASTAYNLSLLYGDRLGNSSKGIEYAHQALEYDLEGGGEENVYLALDYALLAGNYSRANNYSQAMLYADKGIVHARLYGIKSPNIIARCLRTKSEIVSKKGRHDEAVKIGKESLTLVRSLVAEDHRWTCSNYLNLAGIYLAKGAIKEAESYYLKTEKVAKVIKRDLFLIETYQNLAEIYLKKNDWTKADEILGKLSVVLNDRFKEADYFHRLLALSYVKLYEAQGKHDMAREKLEVLIVGMKDTYQYPDLQIEIKAYQALLSEAGNIDTYYAFISELVQIKNRYPNRFNKIAYANKIKLDIAKVLFKVYNESISDNSAQLAQIMFTLIEMNKNSILLEGIQSSKLKKVAGVPPSVLTYEGDLLDSLQLVERRLYLATQSKQQPTAKVNILRDKQLGLEKTFDSLQSQIMSTYPRLSRLKQLSAQTKYSSIQKDYLKENELIIEYFMEGDRWYRMELYKDTLKVVSDTTVATIDSLVTNLLKDISKQQYNQKDATRLTQLLLPTLTDDIEHLVFITDGILSLLPFEVLTMEDNRLIDQYAISYAGSLQLLVEQKTTDNTGERWVGFAPIYDDQPLLYNELEVQQIQSVIGGDTYLGEKATKANFISDGPNYAVLHLAAHTEIDQNNSQFNRMLFANHKKEGTLTASEIYGLHLEAKLAVLSSCNTGFGALEKGEGVMSMSRAFTYAGVGSTLMSLWKVPDKETAAIIGYFYESLALGTPKDVALQYAKIKYLKNTEDAALKQPFYWAGFVLSGDTSPISLSHDSSYRWLFFVGTIVLILTLIMKKWANQKGKPTAQKTER